jgi:hypothetical protein
MLEGTLLREFLHIGFHGLRFPPIPRTRSPPLPLPPRLCYIDWRFVFASAGVVATLEILKPRP